MQVFATFFSFLYYCFNISKITFAAEPLIRTSSPLAFRLIAYSSNAADFILSPEGGVSQLIVNN